MKKQLLMLVLKSALCSVHIWAACGGGGAGDYGDSDIHVTVVNQLSGVGRRVYIFSVSLPLFHAVHCEAVALELEEFATQQLSRAMLCHITNPLEAIIERQSDA